MMCLSVCMAMFLAAGDELKPRNLRLSVVSHQQPEGGGVADVRPDPNDGAWRVMDVVELPFASVRRAEVEPPRHGKGDVRARIDFSMKGEEDPARRVLVELIAANPEGRTIYHTWQLQHDARLNKPIQMGSRMGWPSLENGASFRLPARLLSRLASVKFCLKAMQPHQWRHFPASPSPVELAMSRPDDAGKFELSFSNPIEEDRGVAFDPTGQQVIVTFLVPDAGGQPGKRTVRTAEPRQDGRYSFTFQAESKHLESATVTVAFVQRQPGNPEFAKQFFSDGQAGPFSGSWFSITTPVAEIPFIN